MPGARRQGSSEEDPEVMMHEPGVREPVKRIQESYARSQGSSEEDPEVMIHEPRVREAGSREPLVREQGMRMFRSQEAGGQETGSRSQEPGSVSQDPGSGCQ